MKKAVAAILAAGRSQRMNDIDDKLMIKIGDREALYYSLEEFANSEYISKLIIVCIPGHKDYMLKWLDTISLGLPVYVVEGGSVRQESVQNALNALDDNDDYIMIHDGARAFVTRDIIEKCYHAVIKYDACVAAMPVKDTIKRVDSQDYVIDTPNRSMIWAAQTPQCFKVDVIKKAHEAAKSQGYEGTDDAVLCERIGKKIKLIKASYDNIKLTTLDDVAVGKAILERTGRISIKQEVTMRVGIGYDVHALVDDRDLVLGGVDILHDKGLLGHSDADVLTHAIMDAILGAAALGDIGKLFPDTDIAFKGARSVLLLEKVVEEVRKKGYEIINIDATICAQKPRLAPYIDLMRDTLAEHIGINVDCVSVKATTTEKLGFEGRMEGVSAQAVALINKVLL